MSTVVQDIAQEGAQKRYEWAKIKFMIIVQIKKVLLETNSLYPDCNTENEAFDK